jgi:sulfatase modifying factor 1
MTPRSGALAGLAAGLAVAACGGDEGAVRNQWLVTIATDAPVPQLGDRVLVEALTDDGELACSACRRELGAGTPAAWPLSFGIVPGSGIARLRVRLYRSAVTGPDGLPGGAGLIDFVGRLPAPHGKTPLHVVLRTECFAQPADLAAARTCLPGSGTVGSEPLLDAELPLPAAGSTPFAERSPCPGSAPDGMACVPGGLFLLGSPLYSFPVLVGGSTPEHLVVLSPFALDVRELTVGEVRALVRGGRMTHEPVVKGLPSSVEEACAYLGPDDPENDALPVNCLPKSAALEACAALGKRLPSEAEWEWAAGNLEQETTYPWGADDDSCDKAVVGRGREVFEAIADENPGCRTGTAAQVLPWGPVAGGSAADTTELGLLDLGGNVSEFVADQLSEYDDPCWNGGPVLVDPVCDTSPALALGNSPGVLLRGAAWSSMPGQSRVAARVIYDKSGQSPANGVRCALSLR